jgi:hypothetical protein
MELDEPADQRQRRDSAEKEAESLHRHLPALREAGFLSAEDFDGMSHRVSMVKQSRAPSAKR